jgi:transposase
MRDHQEVVGEEKTTNKKANYNKPAFDTWTYLKSIHGVDVMAIYGIADMAALEILSETGTDMSKWPTAKHFVSWLNLCPNKKITGGKLISSML